MMTGIVTAQREASLSLLLHDANSQEHACDTVIDTGYNGTLTLPSPPVKRGEVVLALFPNSNHRTAKTRPALVIQANHLQTGLPQVIVAMITSQMFRAGHPSRVTIMLSTEEGQQSGLLANSVVMTDNLATITEPSVYRVIGSLPMTKGDEALRHTLGL